MITDDKSFCLPIIQINYFKNSLNTIFILSPTSTSDILITWFIRFNLLVKRLFQVCEAEFWFLAR